MRSRWLGLAALAMSGPLAFAAANPHIIINSDPPNPIVITTTSFTFGANPFGGGDYVFQNASGKTWESLNFAVTLPALETITAGPGPFVTSTIAISPQPNGDFLYNILFGPAVGAIPNGTIFSIDLNNSGTDPNGAGDWGAGNDFTATVNSTPEPSTLAMGIGGLLVVGGVYRRRKSRVG